MKNSLISLFDLEYQIGWTWSNQVEEKSEYILINPSELIQGFNNWYPAFFSDFITTFQSHSYKLYQAQGLYRVCLSLYVVLCLAVYLYGISVFLSFFLSLCMAVFWHVRASIYRYVCLLACLFIYIYLYGCLLACLYVHLFR